MWPFFPPSSIFEVSQETVQNANWHLTYTEDCEHRKDSFLHNSASFLALVLGLKSIIVVEGAKKRCSKRRKVFSFHFDFLSRDLQFGRGKLIFHRPHAKLLSLQEHPLQSLNIYLCEGVLRDIRSRVWHFESQTEVAINILKGKVDNVSKSWNRARNSSSLWEMKLVPKIVGKYRSRVRRIDAPGIEVGSQKSD